MKLTDLTSGLGASILALAGMLALSGPASAQSSPEKWARLTGIWGGATTIESALKSDCFNKVADVGGARVSERTDVYGRSGGARWIAFEQDCGIRNRGRINKPLYKPEFWEYIRLLDYNGNVGGEWYDYSDPEWRNQPRGTARLGPPNKIVYNNDPIRGEEAIFMWVNNNTYKIIDANCKPYDETLMYDQNHIGHSRGCWEGDSFVVRTTGYAPGWYHWSGWVHSNELEMVETYTPSADGATMTRAAVFTDPYYLLAPFQWDTFMLQRNTNPEAVLVPDVPYIEHSLGVMGLPRNRG